MILLSAQPCADIVSPVDPQGHSISETSHIDQPTQDCGMDDCSPFCICSCCSHPAASKQIGFSISVEAAPLTVQTTVGNYQNPYKKTSLSTIWQPPKA